MPEISPSGSQRFKEKQFITVLRDMMPKHSYVPPKFYSCPKHMKSLQDFCIQRPFSPREKQTEYLFTYVRLSPLGTGPKPNNQPLLRRWLWTKPSWGSISCRLIYSCVSAKQPGYEQKHQQEPHKYPGTLEARLGRRKKKKKILCAALLGSLMETDAWFQTMQHAHEWLLIMQTSQTKQAT